MHMNDSTIITYPTVIYSSYRNYVSENGFLILSGRHGCLQEVQTLHCSLVGSAMVG